MSEANQRWLRLRTSSPFDLREPLIALFWDLQTTGIEESESDGSLNLTAYFPLDSPTAPSARDIGDHLRHLGFPDLSWESGILEVDPDEWIEKVKENFQAFNIGRTYFIRPPWIEASSLYPVDLIIEPGRAFGTGTHESTQLVLMELAKLARQVGSLIDVGTGSGILALGAKKLNPNLKIVALDVDPLSVESAKEACRLNAAQGIHLVQGAPQCLRGRTDLVVANLTLGIFEQVAGELIRLTGKYLVLSGFTCEQERAIVDLFRVGTEIRVVGRRRLRGWSCLSLFRGSFPKIA